MGGKNTVSSSKRRKGNDRRFSTKSKHKPTDKLLPPPAVISVKPRHHHIAAKAIAAIALIIILITTGTSWHRRSVRRQALLDDLDNDRLLSNDGEKDAASLLEELRKKNGPDPASLHHAVPHVSHQHVKVHEAEHHTQPSHHPSNPHQEAHNEIHHVSHQSVSHEHHSGEHNSASHHGHDTHAHHESAHHSPGTHHEADRHHGSEGAGEVPQGPVAASGVSIKNFRDVIEWYTRDDLKGGGRPLCRISKPCMLSNGVIAVPSWMKKSEGLLNRCGLGEHTFYEEGTKLPGVQHVQEIGVDFALTIHPTKFQEPTHILSVFFTEHVLKSSFLFDTFGKHVKYGDGIKETHCFASDSGTDCTNDETLDNSFQPGLFVPKRLQLGKSNAWGMKLVEMFGIGHSRDKKTVHLNLATMLVPGHKDLTENLSATCFRSILTADAMFRHFPPGAMVHSSLFSHANGISRTDRKRLNVGGKCSINIGIFDLQEGPKGIIGVEDFKSSLEQFAKLALPNAHVNVELIRVTPDTQIENHIKLMQTLDVFIAGSGDEMSSLSFLRGSAVVFEILQFGLNPDTYQSLANSIEIQYHKLHSKPATQIFKACMETQVMNMRKKGKLGETEYPPWFNALMETWDAAAGEYTLGGKTKFDLLTNNTAIANFDSRHCGKMQSLVFNHEDSARSIIMEAKGLCESA